MFWKLLKKEFFDRLIGSVVDGINEKKYKAIREKCIDEKLKCIFENHQMEENIKDYDNRHYLFINGKREAYKYEYTCKICGLKIHSKTKADKSGEIWELQTGSIPHRVIINSLCTWIPSHPDDWDIYRKLDNKNCYSNEEWKRLKTIKGILE